MINRPLFVAVVFGLSLLTQADVSSGAGRQKKVLVLYPVRRDSQLAIIGNHDLPTIIEAGLNESIDYYSEYVDASRFRGPDYEQAFRDFLRIKYEPQHLDLIIAMSSSVGQFVASHRDDFFPDTPVVFFEGRSASPERMANSTGVVSELRLDGTLDLALALQPDLRRVFVVTTSDSNIDANATLSRRQLAAFESRVALTYLIDLPRADIESQLAALPEHSMILYLMLNHDSAGESFHPLDYLDRMATYANAPIYSWVDSTIDRGVVGGVMKDQRAETRQVARLALRVLKGEPADAIPLDEIDLNVSQVDWRQLKRWNIDEARVPAATAIRFREPRLWERYRSYFLVFIAVMIGQAALIGLLLAQRVKLRRAQAEASGSQAKLRISYDRIRDLGRRLLLAQEAERSRIARELHDDIGQQLALLSIQLDRVRTAASSLDRGARNLIDQTMKRTRSMSKNLHDLSHRLHPAVLAHVGLVDALRSMLEEASSPSLVVTFTHHHVPLSLPHNVTLCLFRITQEALQNVIKHSHARNVRIDLLGSGTEVLLRVEDDGVGFDVDAVRNQGLGLLSMEERLDAIDGLLNITTQPGRGTRLTVVVPLAGLKSDAVAESRPITPQTARQA